MSNEVLFIRTVDAEAHKRFMKQAKEKFGLEQGPWDELYIPNEYIREAGQLYKDIAEQVAEEFFNLDHTKG